MVYNRLTFSDKIWQNDAIIIALYVVLRQMTIDASTQDKLNF